MRKGSCAITHSARFKIKLTSVTKKQLRINMTFIDLFYEVGGERATGSPDGKRHRFPEHAQHQR